jgi:lysophospholipase L1-like esterase
VAAVDVPSAVAVALGVRQVVVASAAGPSVLEVVDPGRPLAAVTDTNGDGFVTVTCLGDSNTMFDHIGNVRRSWCELLDDAIANPNWRIVNRSLLGMTAVDLGRKIADTDAYVDAPSETATVTIDATLRNDRADVAVLAFGTNDLTAIAGRKVASPTALVEAYQRHVAKLERGGVGLVLVALTPPTVPPAPASDAAAITAGNELLRARFPAASLLDFYSVMCPEDYGGIDHDGVHIGRSGQWKRMEVAYRRLVLGE